MSTYLRDTTLGAERRAPTYRPTERLGPPEIRSRTRSDRDSWIDERRADSALVQAAAALSETSGRLRMAGEDAQAVPWRSLGWFAGSVSRTVSSGSSALCC